MQIFPYCWEIKKCIQVQHKYFYWLNISFGFSIEYVNYRTEDYILWLFWLPKDGKHCLNILTWNSFPNSYRFYTPFALLILNWSLFLKAIAKIHFSYFRYSHRSGIKQLNMRLLLPNWTEVWGNYLETSASRSAQTFDYGIRQT